MKWWSLQPVQRVNIPIVSPPEPANAGSATWGRNEVDAFILTALQSQGLQPNGEADKPTLARRLSLALTGLPPAPETLSSFLDDDSPQAFDNLVSSLLDSQHFGERWARHWMDVVHYSDTHGYEWDVPVKNACVIATISFARSMRMFPINR